MSFNNKDDSETLPFIIKNQKETIKVKENNQDYSLKKEKISDLNNSNEKIYFSDSKVMTIEELLECGLYEDRIIVQSNYPTDIETGFVMCIKK